MIPRFLNPFPALLLIPTLVVTPTFGGAAGSLRTPSVAHVILFDAQALANAAAGMNISLGQAGWRVDQMAAGFVRDENQINQMIVALCAEANRDLDSLLYKKLEEELAKLGPLVLTPVSKLLEHPNESNRIASVKLLAQLRDTAGFLYVLQTFLNLRESEKVRFAAGVALRDGGEPALEAMMKFVGANPPENALATTLPMLASMENPRTAPLFANLVNNHPSIDIRLRALRYLARVDPDNHIDIILNCLKADADPQLRLLAAEMLGELNPYHTENHKRAWEALKNVYDDSDPLLHTVVVQSTDIRLGLAEFLQGQTAYDRAKAIQILLKQAYPAAGIVGLIAVAEVDDGNDAVDRARRKEAIEAIFQIANSLPKTYFQKVDSNASGVVTYQYEGWQPLRHQAEWDVLALSVFMAKSEVSQSRNNFLEPLQNPKKWVRLFAWRALKEFHWEDEEAFQLTQALQAEKDPFIKRTGAKILLEQMDRQHPQHFILNSGIDPFAIVAYVRLQWQAYQIRRLLPNPSQSFRAGAYSA